MVVDRFRASAAEKVRVVEAIELALKRGSGRVNVYAQIDEQEAQLWRWSTGLHCPESDLRYSDPQPALFSFNSAFGACDTCRGFGRVIGIDFGLVIPDERKTLRSGAIKTLQTPAWKECQDDLMKYAGEAGIPRDTAWAHLTPAQRGWVIDGSPSWNGKWNQQWYGVRRFFEYLESKAYKMHIRVLLSKYRSYTPCHVCGGARLKTEALLWRLGSKANADAALPPSQRFMPVGTAWSREQLEAHDGLALHDLMRLPIDRLRRFFDSLSLPDAMRDEALKLLQGEIRTRLKYLCDVGIGYLTLDRQSRTLSGGEVQRINLTTALGTSLVNTMFVLDEPSIGLHPRDIGRIVQAMHRLRDAGNTLVVVEHDPAVMLAADRLIDMGPGPGERGGQIVFDGTPDQAKHADTLTGAYLGARKHVASGIKRLVGESTPRLVLEGAREHNLKGLTITFPLRHLVAVTGVSGSGKSTVMQDLLYPALARQFGKATETPGAHDRLLGADWLADAVFVDQSPIGKTTRSNPASYVGAFDELRKLFAELPLARERGYGAGMFSFNAGNGRCPTCGGSGFEHVEMQFLSDVYLRCPDCDGRRYRAELLDVKIVRGDRQLSIADTLDLTVSEAVRLFCDDREVQRVLQPIVDVGLEYVRLGQPVPTLSGGEAQRLKLAGFLAESNATPAQRLARKGTLYLFDEPTTGLHFDDIAKLMRALRKLLDGGHSVIVIEHNLDVIRAADWVIDLGPEGGEAGGELVFAGTAEDIRHHPSSHTGRALADYEIALGLALRVEDGRPLQHAVRAARRRPEGDNHIRIVNAREHNLKSLDVAIPRGKFSVITGVSGSGKSTLAFDILFNEGQRRYLESLNAYARSIVQPAGRPEVDAVYGIPPTVAIEQRLSRGGRKSTVATATEVWHFLRLLWVKLGLQHCSKDGTAVRPQSAESIAAQLLRDHRGQHVGLLAPLVVARKGVYTDLAKWAKARGHTHLRIDGEFVKVDPFPRIDRFKEHTIELPVGDLRIDPAHEAELRELLARTLDLGKGVMHLLTPLDGLQRAMESGETAAGIGSVKVFSTKRACPTCGTSYAELDPRLFSYNSKHGWCSHCVGTGLALTREQRKALDDSKKDDDKGREQSFPSEEPEVEGLAGTPCPACQGTRLNATARGVTFDGQPIGTVAAWSVQAARRWVGGLALLGRDAEIARDVVSEIKSRLEFLDQVGLGYLTLDRAAPTLSGGEAQRIRLAAQLGSNLQGVCYVLDEPTIGLHPRDNRILLDALAMLSAKGNTLVVVEHDEDTIRRAEHRIDIGPGAGKRGGRLVAEGSVADLSAQSESVTGRFLAHPLKHPLQARRAVHGQRRSAVAARRIAAQPAPDRRALAPAAAGGGQRRLGIGQEHAGARRAAGQRGGAGRYTRQVGARRLRCARRLAVRGPRARGRPDADRQDTALLPGDLYRLLGCDPQAIRRNAGGQGPGLRAEPFFLQYRPGPLPRLRGPGRAHDRNELPARRESALRLLPWPALQPGDAGRELARQEHRRRAAHGGRRGGGFLRLDAGHRAPAAAAARRRPRLPDPGPAFADAVRRRSAAHQAGHRVVESARRRHPPRPEAAAHAVCARRAHRRPAHGRCRAPDPRAAPAGRRRPQRDRDRARPGRHRRGRLGHRPRPRGWRRGRPRGRGRHTRAGGGRGQPHRRGPGFGAAALSRRPLQPQRRVAISRSLSSGSARNEAPQRRIKASIGPLLASTRPSICRMPWRQAWRARRCSRARPRPTCCQSSATAMANSAQPSSSTT